MSGLGWNEGEAREGLPRVEQLRTVDGGYERRSVEEAFDAFYRHAAQLDASLRVLESVETFRRDSAALREDLRALRAASWGPVPAARQPWSTSGGSSWRTDRRGSFDLLPRMAVEAAFIVAVAVAVGLSGLSTPWVVGLVLASWVVVGAGEVALAVARPRASAPAVLPPPRHVEEPAPVAAVEAPDVLEAVPTVGEDTQASLEPVATESEPEPGPDADAWPEIAAAEEEPDPSDDVPEPEEPEEPEAVVEPEPEPEPEPEAEAEAEASEPEPELVSPSTDVVEDEQPDEPEAVVEPDPTPEPVEEAPPAGESTEESPAVTAAAEPEPVETEAPEEGAIPAGESWAAAEPEPEPRRRRFFGRRREEPLPEAEPTYDPPRNVRILPDDEEPPVAEQQPEDPWETAPELPPEPELVPAVAPEDVAVPWEAAPEAAGTGAVEQTDDADTDERLELPTPRQEPANLRRGRR